MTGDLVTRLRQRTLAQIVDEWARDEPDYPYAHWIVEQDPSSPSVQTITYSQLSSIVNHLSYWLVEQLGPERKGEVLTYIGPNDVRFTALVLATIKTGFRLFTTSPRNSAVAHRRLFETLNCRTLITPDPSQQPALSVLEAVQPCQALAAPSLDELLRAASTPFINEKSLSESRLNTIFIIHTSGSTGIPKPLDWQQETAIRHIEASGQDAPTGAVSIDSLIHGKRVVSTLPPFHGAGLVQHLLYAIPFGNIVIIPAANGAIVTAQGVVDALKQTPADVAVMVPSIVAELAQNPELLDYCAKNLELILYIGGDLPQVVGDIVASKVPLRCWWGASEVGMPQELIVSELGMDQGGWHYVRFHPSAGAVFDEVSDGLYELCIRREEKIINTQTTFTIADFEKLTEYRTRDLFEPHPTVKNAWKWRARADDIIVFLNGEKTNPVSMEQYVVANNPDAISGALVVGAQRFQAALVIDPVDKSSLFTTADQASLIERVWLSVEEANKKAPAHARVEKSLILVAQQPFIRAGKGTIQRAATIAQYKAEIEKLYTATDTSSYSYGEHEVYAEVTDVPTATRLIRNTISSVGGNSEIGDDDNFFDSGMDSLQALRLVRTLRTALNRPGLALSTVYQNPTLEKLATSMLSNAVDKSNDQIEAVQLLNTYQSLIRDIPKQTVDNSDKKQNGRIDVLLTGSTGTLGTSILNSLLAQDQVGHVFCLNRSEHGGRLAQHARFTAAELDTGLLESRATFLRANLADVKLGLDEETYNTLTSRVGLLVHNAWPVNFNLPLLAFRPLLAGLVNLFKFAAKASHPSLRTIFISSVSATAGADTTAVAETVPDETSSLRNPVMNGYAGSKLLAEILCDSAARHLGADVAILRVGQVGGPTAPHGAIWNPAEWLPSLVISSISVLKCLPDSLGPHFSDVDWVPSDLLGPVVTDLSLANTATSQELGAKVFNVRNPRTATWASLLPVIQETAKTVSAADITVVSSAEWLKRLDASEKANPGHGIDNPAVKLLDFYHHGLQLGESGGASLYPPMAIDRAAATSATLRDMPAVSAEWMRKWVGEWMSAKDEADE
ncbi:hypothetical protein F5Y16DRAFT_364823 [Xylariaceae sp. FL0255]|nr:hypothetical protein F5Y16DRAFT_364823 [Xylariaceae sp. FL0255]